MDDNPDLDGIYVDDDMVVHLPEGMEQEIADRLMGDPDVRRRLGLVDGAILWACNYYDGPLDGIALTAAGRLAWFSTPADPVRDDHRVYQLYELTDEELRWEVTTHMVFEQEVGTHTCEHVGHGRLDGELRPVSQHHRFYDRYLDEAHARDYTTDREPFGTLYLGLGGEAP